MIFFHYIYKKINNTIMRLYFGLLSRGHVASVLQALFFFGLINGGKRKRKKKKRVLASSSLYMHIALSYICNIQNLSFPWIPLFSPRIQSETLSGYPENTRFSIRLVSEYFGVIITVFVLLLVGYGGFGDWKLSSEAGSLRFGI